MVKAMFDYVSQVRNRYRLFEWKRHSDLKGVFKAKEDAFFNCLLLCYIVDFDQAAPSTENKAAEQLHDYMVWHPLVALRT